MEARFTSAITSERMPKGFCRGDFCLYAELSIIGAKMSQNFILVVAKRFLHFFISYLHHVYFLICINILNLRLRKHIKILRFWKCCTRGFLCLTIRFLSSHFCTQVMIFIVSLNKQIILEDPTSLHHAHAYLIPKSSSVGSDLFHPFHCVNHQMAFSEKRLCVEKDC